MIKNIFKFKFSFFSLILFIVASVSLTFVFSKIIYSKNNSKQVLINENLNTNKVNNDCLDYKITRLKGYKYIKPIMFIDNDCQSEKLRYIKTEVSKVFDEYKQNGSIISASFYLKDYLSNDWIALNENEKYSPGSILKVPALITILKMSEINPHILSKKITYNKVYNVDVHPKYVSKNAIELGKSYTVKELLSYMIKYSDNNATLLLNEVIDVKLFKKLFTDFGFKEVDWNASDYEMNVKECSYFLHALYDANYLNLNNSEFAIELLSKSDFKEGITSSIPSNINVAEKFGESGDLNTRQMHETAIIYLNERPYLLTIMTKGKEINNLPEVIKKTSYAIYSQMNLLNNK